jgi:hypothetical protein
LASGDIAAAARAAMGIRQTDAQASIEGAKTRIDEARTKALENASIKLGGVTYKKTDLEAMVNYLEFQNAMGTIGGGNFKGYGKKTYPSSGGLITGYSTGGMVNYFANGGFSRGTDTIPAMLTPGEFVIKKAAVDRIGAHNLRSLNSGVTTTSSADSVYNYNVTINAPGNSDTNDLAELVISKIKQIDSQRIRSNVL